MGILIINGEIVNEDRCFKADILIEGGIIKQIGTTIIVPENTKIIDAKGRFLIPGGIDVGTYLNFSQTADDFFSGSKAALAGGTTTIFNFVENNQEEKLVETFQKWQTQASAEVCCNFGLVVELNSMSSNTEEDMKMLTTKGVNAFKVSLANRKFRDEDLLQYFEICSKLGVLPLVHAENGEIIYFNQNNLKKDVYGPEGHLYSRPEQVEEEATNRAIVLAQSCNAPICVINITSKVASKVIAQKREQGIQAYGQPSTAALVLTGIEYLHENWQHAAQYVMSPPLRLDDSTPNNLLQMLSCGSLQFSSSAHQAYNVSVKEMGRMDFTKIPNGVNGIESRMSIIWEKGVKTGIIDLPKFVAITSTNAAKLLNIYPRKGLIAVDSDADIIVWNPDEKMKISALTHVQKCDFNVFEGMEVSGIPEYVICNGKIAVDNKKIQVDHGDGQFLEAPPFSPHVFSRLKNKNVPNPVIRPPKADSIPNELETIKEPPKEFHARPPTKAGGRNLQDSTFSLSGKQLDEDKERTTGVKFTKPPGGDTTSLW